MKLIKSDVWWWGGFVWPLEAVYFGSELESKHSGSLGGIYLRLLMPIKAM